MEDFIEVLGSIETETFSKKIILSKKEKTICIKKHKREIGFLKYSILNQFKITEWGTNEDGSIKYLYRVGCEMFSVEGNEKAVFIYNLGVTEKNIGLGTKLMKKTISHLRKKGLNKILLYVDNDNLPANRLYDKFGFKHNKVGNYQTLKYLMINV